MEWNYVATCLFGLEGLLGEEIDRLGYQRTETMDGRISFRGDAGACAVCSIQLRFAERLYLCLGTFLADTFDALFEGTRALPWEEVIGRNDEFPVSGHAIKSALFSVPDCQRIIKKAISVRLGQRYGLTILPETGERRRVEFFLFKDRASLMLDLSGVPLHKRGYRPETVAAPLRETLAAALVKLARPRDEVLLWDPFCGSGTIAIEAAMGMRRIAPGLRRTFAAENHPLFPKESFREARASAEAEILPEGDCPFEAYASDLDRRCVDVARASVERAGLGKTVKCFPMNALDIETRDRRGTVVTNPPYGERLLSEAEAEDLYRKMGAAFAKLERWQIYVLTPNESFPKLYGRRADKIRKLYNGMIPCYYYQFFKNGGEKK